MRRREFLSRSSIPIMMAILSRFENATIRDDGSWNLASAVDRNQRKLPMIHVKHRVNSSYPLTHELGGPLGRVKGKPRRETAHLPNGGESSFISSSSSLVGERSRCRELSGLIVISHHPVVCYHFSPPSLSPAPPRAPFHRND